MDFEKICKERYSVRSFAEKNAESEKIDKILELVRLAPTAINQQPYEIYVVTGREKVEELSPRTFGASTLIVICRDENKKWNNRYSGENQLLQDIGIVATTVIYGALEYGLDAIYVCNFDPDVVKEKLSLPKNLVASCVIPIGYRAENSKPSPMHYSRRKTEEFVHKI